MNAQNSAQTQKTQADAGHHQRREGAPAREPRLRLRCRDRGAAAKQGVKVIDYDRLTLSGSASYYVSFDNVTVGKLQGQGLVKCLKADGSYGKKPVVAELNGSPTDNNATLFAQGYNSVLNPLYKSGTFKKGPNQSVPDWDNQKALTIFEEMLTKTSNKINGVARANDGLGNSVISGAQGAPAEADPGHRSGRDRAGRAEHPRRRSVHDRLQGRARGGRRGREARDLADQGRQARRHRTAAINNGKRKVPSVLLTPVVDHEGELQDPVRRTGYLKKSDVCNGAYAKYCK